MLRQYIWNELNRERQDTVLARPRPSGDAGLSDSVTRIIDRVRRDGDAALLALTEELDGVSLEAIEVTDAEFDEAAERLGEAPRRAIRLAADNIEAFHEAQLPEELRVDTAPGVCCERLTRPIERVGLYVPAGSAPLPSTALMLGVPARLARCPTRIMCSPVQADGRVDSAVLYAARVSGIGRVFKLGGAQAVAAMAYGTETVPKVDKVFGPGNPWVTEAKEQVDRDPRGAARDYPAGPSEVLVVADDRARPDFVAADLLSQAEHGGDSQVLLVTTSQVQADAVREQVERQKRTLSRLEIIDEALANSSIIIVDDPDTALEVSNRYAPEHLILQLADARRWLVEVRAAGSVFLGPWAPESVGDYCSGTNHVLPTAGFANRYSSLGVTDFLRSMTVQELTREGLQGIGPIAETLAMLEGLDAHAEAVRARLAVIDEESAA